MSALNMNMNMNMNMAGVATSPGRAPGRVRYNTQDYRKFINAANSLLPGNVDNLPNPLPQFHELWDAELRSHIVLRDFVERNPGWYAAIKAITDPNDPRKFPLEPQIIAVLNMAPDREDRFLEIIDQHDAEGAISYYLGMLMVDPAHHPNTYLLIRAARRVGEHVTMCLKAEYRCPRPSQLCPLVVPMVDPPDTPAYPSGHALQARLISRCLRAAWPDLAQPHVLDDLSARIGENRIIAGLHFFKDAEGGQDAADAVFALLNAPDPNPMPQPTLFEQLLADAKAEFRPA